MGLETPYSQMPSTPEPIIAQVRRQLADDASPDRTLETTVLDIVAERVVLELWSSRVKTFVPVLALRQAREVLREQGVAIAAAPPETRSDRESVAMRLIAERPGRDVLPIGQDVLSVDDRDVLSLL